MTDFTRIKKEIKTAAKFFAKMDNLYITADTWKNESVVYVSDGCFLIRVPEAIYTGVFMEVSPRFVPVSNSCSYTAHGKKAIPIPSFSKMDLGKFIEDAKKENTTETTQTPFYMEVPDGRLLNIYIDTCGHKLFINSEAVKALKPLIGSFAVFYRNERNNSSLVCDNDDFAVLLLPVNVDLETKKYNCAVFAN